MNIIQVTACQPGIYFKNISEFHHLSKAYVCPMNTRPLSRTLLSLRGKPSYGLQCVPNSKSPQPLHVCFAGGKGMMENNSEDSPWKAFEKAMEKFKGQSIEDVLQQQIEKGRGSGVKPPRGGGGGGGGSGGGSGGSEDGRFTWMSDEAHQVVLATIGFIFVYIYIISGEELTKLARDYIKYLSSGKQSVRLKRAMFKWGRLYQSLTEKVVDRNWLEKTTRKRNYLESKSDE